MNLHDLPPKYREQVKAQLEPKVAETLTKRKGRPEGEFQASVVAFAESQGWLCYHTYDSRRSTPGFPDLVMLRGHRVVVAELKTGNKKTTPEQDRWSKAWLDAGAQAYEWRPGDESEIERVLL